MAELTDWQKKIIEKDGAPTTLEDWQKAIILRDAVTDPDDLDDAPARIRLEVGALDKPEDRLTALRKHYPDAQPTGDDGSNFIMTDPESGKVIQYNKPNWNPFNAGDLASIAPEIGSTIGGSIGSILGAIGGGAAGSAVPVVGTGAGAIAGGMTGAGTGSALGKQAVSSGLNYIFGNDDTRSTGEVARDLGTEFAMGALGEGAGKALGAGAKAAKNAWVRGAIGGGVDDPIKAAERAADLRAIGAEPTAGMVNGKEKSSLLEHALLPTRRGNQIQARIDDAFGAQKDEFGRIVGSLSEQPLDIASAGARLRDQAELAKEAAKAQSEKLYGAVDQHVTSPAVATNTSDFLANLTKERAGFNKFDEMTKAAQTDKVIAQTSAILEDAQNGMSFDQLKSARSFIGNAANDETDKVLKNHLNGLYASLTKDMEATAANSGDEGLSAFKSANDFYRDEIASPEGFGKGGAAHKLLNEADTDRLMGWVTATDASGGNRIAAVRRTIQKSDGGAKAWDDITAGVIDRLGRNKQGNFDPGTYLKNWTDMSDNAKSAMFSGTGNAQLRSDLDRLARVSENWTKYRKGVNGSNTENHRAIKDSLNPFSKDNLMFSVLGSVATGDPTGMIAGTAAGVLKKAVPAAGNKLLAGSRAKLLTSPETVNWLSDIPKAEMQKGGLKAHLDKLNQIRKTTQRQGLAQAIGDYMFSVGYEPERNEE
ncbi:hypothetical protein [Neorhizobium sp. NCHU2750]|uniref:hypothetical protein n=1 Tax=Neorhizobium sp. NCHU2750 TaxID=1825976 RepID=UPI000E7189A6|nr:hypothetical protein NCHU2750_15210 [Neorhizobium sp. NCHU2750]